VLLVVLASDGSGLKTAVTSEGPGPARSGGRGKEAVMKRELRLRFWVESTLAIASMGLLLLTLVWHDWIELVFDPDHHSGSLEWVILVVAFIIAATFLISARSEWRRGWSVPAADQASA